MHTLYVGVRGPAAALRAYVTDQQHRHLTERLRLGATCRAWLARRVAGKLVRVPRRPSTKRRSISSTSARAEAEYHGCSCRAALGVPSERVVPLRCSAPCVATAH
jgi:hypothetical protein